MACLKIVKYIIECAMGRNYQNKLQTNVTYLCIFS